MLALSLAETQQSGESASAAGTLPSGWPSTLQIGIADSPGGASAAKSVAPFGFRYQYLAGGVNTGNGWANWNSNGQFATYYIQDSVANSITPVFTYYMIFQSAPGNSQGEQDGVLNNLSNTSTMTAYWNDLKLFFQRAGAFPNNRVVLHVEPDMWGYVQQRTSGDNPTTVAARVGSTGLSELSGLPDNMSGFAKAVVKLRDTYAPNVVLGYHMSGWGTGIDIQWSQTNDATTDQLATRAGNFYNALGANFDLTFAEFSDRDAGFKQAIYGDGGASWFDADDFARHARFLKTFSNVTQKRVVLWQIPLGNTKMRAQNNTWNHYQDNRVEWLLDEPARTHLSTYVDAGVVAFLFGRGADGATCACDANGDGVTNPSAINGNTLTSLNADDDGGFFKQKAAAYYAQGAMSLSGGTPLTGLLRVTTLPALPTQVLVNGVPMNDWAVNWVKLVPGSYTVSFTDVQGYTTPAPQTVLVTAGNVTSVQGSFVRRGNLRVITSPAVPSTITIDGIPRNDWGLWTDLPAGSYQVCFGQVAGFNPPPCQQATVVAGQSTVITGNFAVDAGATGPADGFGMLRVTTSPAVPSQIRVDGVPMNDWDLGWVKLAPGTHTISFSGVKDYTTPPSQVVTVTAGGITTVTGNFVSRGWLRVTTSPAVPGTISVNGTPREDWGMWTSVEAGSYEVCFGAVSGFATPACQTVQVTPWNLTSVTGSYGP